MSSSGTKWGPVRRRRSLLGLVVVLMLLSGCNGFAHVPVVCNGCSDGGAAQALPSDAEVGASETHIYLGEEPRVVARTEIDPATAAALRRNTSRQRSVLDAVRRARDPDRGIEGSQTRPTPSYGSGPNGWPAVPHRAFVARNLSVGVAEAEVLVRFRPRAFRNDRVALGRPGYGGSVMVDRFHAYDGESDNPRTRTTARHRIETDELVIHAPPGTRPVVTPSGATVHDDRVRLESLPGDSYVVFAPPGIVGTLGARLTLAMDVLGWAVPTAGVLALFPGFQLVATLAVLRSRHGDVSYARIGLLVLLPFFLVAILPVKPAVIMVGMLAIVVAIILNQESDGSPGADGDAAPETTRASPDTRTEAGDPSERGPIDRAPGRYDLRTWGPPGVVVLSVAIATLVAAAAPRSALPGMLWVAGWILPGLGFAGLRRRAPSKSSGCRLGLALASALAGAWLVAFGYVLVGSYPNSFWTGLVVAGTGIWAVLFGVLGYHLGR